MNSNVSNRATKQSNKPTTSSSKTIEPETPTIKSDKTSLKPDTTNSLKSSVKRLFSPNTTNKSNHSKPEQHLTKSTQSVNVKKTIQTTTSSSSSRSLKTKLDSLSYDNYTNDVASDDSSTVSNLTSLSTPSCSSNSSTLSKTKDKNLPVNKQIRNTPTNSIKKHLNILKSNSKKVLLGSQSTVIQSTNQTQQLTSLKSSSSINTKTSPTTDNKQHVYLAMKLNEYETKIKDLHLEIDSSQRYSSESKQKIKDLQLEIERLSRLYDFEISKQLKYEEKMLSLKQMAEEKQIESAALKYEYRKVQEIKDNLIAENNSLKLILNTLQQQSPMNESRHSSPSSNFNSPRLVHQSFSTAPSTPVVASSLQIQGNYFLIN